MPSVLGKRARELEAPTDPVSSRPRSKRRVQPKIFFDEYVPDTPSKRKQRSKRLDVCKEDEQENTVQAKAVADDSTFTKPIASPLKKRKSVFSAAADECQRNSSDPLGNAVDENTEPSLLRTPSAKRHRDVLSTKTPVTPKRRVIVPGKPVTPSTPRSFHTPRTPTAHVPTIYNSARQLFVRSNNPGKLVGRENERNQISKFIQSRAQASRGGAMYISGPPGTGKSALVDEVCKDLGIGENEMKQVFLNCMTLKTSKDIFSKLAESLEIDLDGQRPDTPEAIQKLLIGGNPNQSKPFLVILDEIDHLLSFDVEALYTLFEWSLDQNSNLILLGIANALDLTDRFLPRLKAKGLKPNLLPFLPYTAPQISSVVTTRLKTLNEAVNPDYVPFIHPAAIQFCSKKVANQTGDLRKAFDLCRKAIDVIEAETKNKFMKQTEGEQSLPTPSKSPLAENPNFSSSPTKSPPQTPSKQLAEALAALTPSTAPRATIGHVAKISSSALGNGTAQRLQGLNLQQKAALCALIALQNRRRSAEITNTPSKNGRSAPTIRVLYECYTGLCRQERLLQPLTSVEFRDVVNSLETLSLVNLFDGRTSLFTGFSTPRQKTKNSMGGCSPDDKQIGSSVSEKELEEAAQGPGSALLKMILSGNGLN